MADEDAWYICPFMGIIREKDWPEYLERWKECTRQLAAAYLLLNEDKRGVRWAIETLKIL